MITGKYVFGFTTLTLHSYSVAQSVWTVTYTVRDFLDVFPVALLLVLSESRLVPVGGTGSSAK